MTIKESTVDTPVIRIEPGCGWTALKLRELWEYRELLYFLAWRDIKVRYKQTLLGAAWAIIQPFFTMVIFSIFFVRLAQIPVGWNTVSHLRLCGFSTLDFFCEWFEPIIQQLGRQCQPDQESLLPALGYTHCNNTSRLNRFSPRLRCFGCYDALLRTVSNDPRSLASSLYPLSSGNLPGRWTVANSSKC